MVGQELGGGNPIINFAYGFIERWIFSGFDEQNKEDLDKMYDDIYDITKKSRIPKTSAFTSGNRSKSRKTTSKRTYKKNISDSEKMKDLVEGALSKLEDAEKFTKCGVCKKTLKEVKGTVKKKTDKLLKSADKYESIQELKSEGVLNEKITWKKLKPQEKKEVNKRARFK